MAMPPYTPRPTFKTPDPSIPLHLRPSSPIAPTWEPLSPPRPVEPTLNHQALAALKHDLSQPHSHQGAQGHHDSKSDGADGADGAASSTRRSSTQSRRHHRTPSTIDDLADAALATTPSAYPPPPTHAQPRKAASISHQPHFTMPQYPMPAAQHSPTSHGEPAAKRARSEVGPSPHHYPYSARPSSSHVHPIAPGWAYNVEQNIDRARRQSTNTASEIPCEDVELLLNFASRVQPRSVKAPSPVHESSSRLPSALAPSVLPPPSLPAPPPPSAQAAPPTEPVQGTPEDPSASLPSPQDTTTNEEERNSDASKAAIEAPTQSASQHDSIQQALVPQQTQTPPEEERSDTVLGSIAPAELGAEPKARTEVEAAAHLRQPSLAAESLSAAETAGDTDSTKSRPRRGWPKGKPRGPRNKTSGNKVRSTARRSRASAKANTENDSTSSGDDMVAPLMARRKSDTDLTPPALVDLAKSRHLSVPPHVRFEILPSRSKSAAGRRATAKKVVLAEDTVCSGCAQTRESSHGELDQWIGCNGCKGWFHYDCAGFKNERDVRDVDKFFCKPCEPKHGATTYVRKSTRTHTNVDYAGLNQGILKTSDEDPEHHYIQPIKDGTLTFDPETFPRMRPELVTAEYIETCASFTEPILVPAAWNPKRQPDLRPDAQGEVGTAADTDMLDVPDIDLSNTSNTLVADGFENAEEQDFLTSQLEYETVFDDGQDKLGMVIPQGLTVRHVANIVGPEEPLEVIDVKTQGTEGKWNLAKFADYYEADGEKAVRNVISLEVSHTKLGKLLRRPKVVRQIDLQDSVWPAEEAARGNYPKVQFYCLMSVADSFTDFHIDFGGSSVYYHILRGRKTFFFIPPKPAHLKAYEDWNNSPEQNFTWLPTKTKECYRVDLYEGDTMLIPSGWIHAVWTPTNSLVIGGNFLTRLHYSTQFRVVDIEKANKTPLKFRYPQFQKVMWYTVIKYLETDPMPHSVAENFYQGYQFHREHPIWEDFFGDVPDTSREPGTAEYNARYYSQAELDGLPDLISFIFRTVMISLGRIEGVSEDTRKKVVRSIPKSFGEPIQVAKVFALWVAWKRGNEDPPAWAHPDADLPDKEAAEPKKLSARALKQLQRQEAMNAYKLAPDRQSARQQATKDVPSVAATSPAPSMQHPQGDLAMPSSQFTSTPKTSVLGPKRVACDACRKRRIRCKHKEQVTTHTPPAPMSALPLSDSSFSGIHSGAFAQPPETQSHQFIGYMDDAPAMPKLEFPQPTVGVAPMAPMAPMMSAPIDANGPALVPGNALLADPNSKRGRSKACLDCRKSKRRCVHDENGKIDPVKAEQTPVPRASAAKKRKISGSHESPTAQKSTPSYTPQSDIGIAQTAPTMPYPMGNGYSQPAPPAPPQFRQQSSYQEPSMQTQWQQPASMYPDPMDGENFAVNNGPYHHQPDMHLAYSQQSLEQLANDVLDSRYVNNDEDGGYTVPQQQQHQHGMQNGQGSMAGAVQALPQSDRQQGPFPILPQSHHSSDSGVAFPESNHMMGGPVQEVKPSSEAANGHQLAKDNIQLNGSELRQQTSRIPVGFVQSSTTEAGAPVQRKSALHEPLAVPQGNGAVSPKSAAVAGNGATTEDHLDNNSIGTVAPSMESTAVVETSPQATKATLSSIPLYEPPPSATKRRPSKPAQSAETFSMPSFDTLQQKGRRRSSASKTPAPMIPPQPETPASAKKRKWDSTSSASSVKKAKINGDGLQNMNKGAVDLQDDESMRLAKELQDQEWSLRRRSKEA